MGVIRPLHPIDMPSYLAFAKNACYGEGVEGCDEGRVPLRFLDFLGRSLALEAPRQTWVYTQGRSILGMVGVKSRPGTTVWEIERLVGLGSPAADAVLESLLEHLAYMGGEEGVQKIFLRLPVASPLLTVARRAGFYAYTVERLFRLAQRPALLESDLPPLRPRRIHDAHALFTHYSRTVPASVRHAEALTLQEWRGLDGWQPRRHWRFSLSRARRDYVWIEEGTVVAAVHSDGRRRILRLSLDAGRVGPREADGVLTFALSHLPPAGAVYCPVRQYQTAEEGALLRGGFVQVEEYALMVKQLSVRVGDRCLVPVGV